MEVQRAGMLGQERTSLILVTCEFYIPRAAVARLGCSGKMHVGTGNRDADRGSQATGSRQTPD